MERSRSASGRYEERAMWCSTGWCIVTLTLGILAAPLAAGAQQAKVARVGYLTFSPITPGQAPMEAFRQGLRALGWVEGQNLVIETRSGEDRYERYADLVTELVRLKVEVIVTSVAPAIQAATHATDTIPIVFVTLADPEVLGFVDSLAQPGGTSRGWLASL